MRTVWFIRHVQSQSNAGLRTESDQAGGVTPLGESQAERLASAFDRQPDLIITSPYVRTQLTAAQTIAKYPTAPREEWDVQEFSHMAVAVRANTTLQERRPLVHEYWERCDPFYVHGEGAECFSDLMDRVYAMHERLVQTKESFIAMFSHSQYIRAVMWMGLSNFFRERPKVNKSLMEEFRAFDEGVPLHNACIVPAYIDDSGELFFGAIRISHLSPELLT